MLPPVIPIDENESGSAVRERQESFEDRLISQSLEFERLRLNVAAAGASDSAYPGLQEDVRPVPPPSRSEQRPEPARTIIVRKPQRVPEGSGEGCEASTIALQRPQHLPEGPGDGFEAGGKIVLSVRRRELVDPYADMYYDAYSAPEKGKGKYLPVKGKWSEMVDDEVAWWYFPMRAFC